MPASDYLLPNFTDGEFSNSTVQPLIDGQEYNEALAADLAAVKVSTATPRFVYVLSHWLGLLAGEYAPTHQAKRFLLGPSVENTPTYFLDPLGTANPLNVAFKELAHAQVEVRVMGWVGLAIDDEFIHLELVQKALPGLAQTINALEDLRTSEIGSNAIMGVLSHPAGSMHLKIVIVGNGSNIVAYTGGIDFAPNRFSPKQSVGNHPNSFFWHDAMARVIGPAVKPIYEHLRQVYNENLDRKRQRFVVFKKNRKVVSANIDDPKLVPIKNWSDLGVTVPPAGAQTVQSLRTVPVFNFKSNSFAKLVPTASFAGTGKFEIRDALLRAIGQAQKYIYIEDQYFWSAEILGAVGKAADERGVKVILIGPGSNDPADPSFPKAFFGNAVANGLFRGKAPTQALLNNVRMFTRWGDVEPAIQSGQFNIVTSTQQGPGSNQFLLDTDLTLNDPVSAGAPPSVHAWIETGGFEYAVSGNSDLAAGSTLQVRVTVRPGTPAPAPFTAALLKWARPIVVHSKITIVDDMWAMIGSANCNRRSLYTEFEHSVAFIDPSGTGVRDLRSRLWAEDFRLADPSQLFDVEKALNGWNINWGTPGPIALPIRTPQIVPAPDYLFETDLVTASQAKLEGREKLIYDVWADPDAREPWAPVT